LPTAARQTSVVARADGDGRQNLREEPGGLAAHARI
jgi:hypothetical protein